MYVPILIIHVIVALFLIAVVLLQGGRGGLGEALGGAAAQSLFGGGANTVMTKITAVAAGLFMVTCLSLAALSTALGRSVIDRLPIKSGGLPLPGALPGFPTPDTLPVAEPGHPAAGKVGDGHTEAVGRGTPEPQPSAPADRPSGAGRPEPAPPANAPVPSNATVPAPATP